MGFRKSLSESRCRKPSGTGREPLDYAHNQMRIAQHNRARILDELVAERESWGKARRCYEITLPEPLDTVARAVWSEPDPVSDKKYDARNPIISSLRRNLQREHLERLIDLSRPNARGSAVYKPIANLAIEQLRQIKQEKIAPALETHAETLDAYTRAHLKDAAMQIEKALEAEYVYGQL